MKTNPKKNSWLLFFTFFSLVLLNVGVNNCLSQPQISIILQEIETTNMSSGKASEVTGYVKNEVARYGHIQKSGSTADVQKIVSGLVFRMNNIFVINLKVKNVENGKLKQITKTSKKASLQQAVKKAVAAVMP